MVVPETSLTFIRLLKTCKNMDCPQTQHCSIEKLKSIFGQAEKINVRGFVTFSVDT